MGKSNSLNILHVGGYDWHQWNDGWATDFDRYHVVTWPFGAVHQSKVFIEYNGKEVGICLNPHKIRRDAMMSGLNWARGYQNRSVPTVDEIFKESFLNYPTLYKTRIDVIDHLLFVSGNGYAWLDGAIQSTSPDDDYVKFDEFYAKLKKMEDERITSINKLLKSGAAKYMSEDAVEILKSSITFEEKESSERPLPDDGKPYSFYPVSEYSKINNIPDDVKPDWLALCYEGAIILRDRSTDKRSYDNKSNREIGAALVVEVERRFPHLKKNT